MCLTAFSGQQARHPQGQFCEFCFQDGQLLYIGDDVHTFRKRYFNKLHAEGSNEFVARFHVLLIGFAPYWKARRY